MSLKHILLGMLAEPHSGYDLKKAFNQSLRNFWNAELSQIYPLLQRLEKDGLLTSKRVASASGPTRRVYSRSDKGRRELMAWLLDGPKVGEERISYIAQVFFLSQLNDPAEAITFMRELRDHMASWLESLQEVERRWAAEDPRYPDQLPDDAFYQQLTLDLGLRKVTCNVEWCDACIGRLEARLEAGSATVGHHLPR